MPTEDKLIDAYNDIKEFINENFLYMGMKRCMYYFSVSNNTFYIKLHPYKIFSNTHFSNIIDDYQHYFHRHHVFIKVFFFGDSEFMKQKPFKKMTRFNKTENFKKQSV